MIYWRWGVAGIWRKTIDINLTGVRGRYNGRSEICFQGGQKIKIIEKAHKDSLL